MSPRAACRLETLGFQHVYDYVPGKADWLAHGLRVEGELAEIPTAGGVARSDVVTCGLDDLVGGLRSRVEGSRYGFALAVSEHGVLLGRLRKSTMHETADDARAEQLMESGPSTVRADTAASELARRLAERDLRTAVVTTPEGKLLGAVLRRDLEAPG